MKHRAKKFHHFGELIKKKRLRLNARGRVRPPHVVKNRHTTYSQQSFAERLGYVNGQFISNVERGICGLPPKMLPKVCEILTISPQVIFAALLKDEYAYLSEEYEDNRFKVFE